MTFENSIRFNHNFRYILELIQWGISSTCEWIHLSGDFSGLQVTQIAFYCIQKKSAKMYFKRDTVSERKKSFSCFHGLFPSFNSIPCVCVCVCVFRFPTVYCTFRHTVNCGMKINKSKQLQRRKLDAGYGFRNNKTESAINYGNDTRKSNLLSSCLLSRSLMFELFPINICISSQKDYAKTRAIFSLSLNKINWIN